ncbi:unnamed protein product [Pleuronectes platessa]|uniref:Uncharacterized protein n=1 Tax=Pleuronectes platessa TaxID=8262 RepID=A0A9N7TW15_PLEPL|nr:unnamed protein product [Pleuronectes platessa]
MAARRGHPRALSSDVLVAAGSLWKQPTMKLPTGAIEGLSMLQPVLEVREVVGSVPLLCIFGRWTSSASAQQCLGLNELCQRHGSMTGLLQKAGLCATTTKQGSRLCLGAGTAQQACLDSECHRLL